MTRETYYQRHKDVILKEQKDYYENDKKKTIKRASKNQIQRITWRRKKYRGNMEETDILICLKKRNNH